MPYGKVFEPGWSLRWLSGLEDSVSLLLDVCEDFFCRKENFPRKKRPHSKEGTNISKLKMGGSWNMLDSLKGAQKAY